MPSKSGYARSSDIQARSLLKYRFDMKKKAIMELEVREWLETRLRRENPAVKVFKSGGDADLWFGREEKNVRGDPDYEARVGDQVVASYELQNSDGDTLKQFDFKVSKVGEKPPKQDRIPHSDREFLYIIKSPPSFRFISPSWVMDHGKEGPVPAWGNRGAYRVPRADFLPGFEEDEALAEALYRVALKERAWALPQCWLRLEAYRFAREIDRAFERKGEFGFVPKSAEGIYTACLVLRFAERNPIDPGAWLDFLFTLRPEGMDPEALARLVFALDFLYLAFPPRGFPENKKPALGTCLGGIRGRIHAFRDQIPRKGGKATGRRERAALLFAVDAYEDVVQDAAAYGAADVRPVRKIYETLGEKALRVLAPAPPSG